MYIILKASAKGLLKFCKIHSFLLVTFFRGSRIGFVGLDFSVFYGIMFFCFLGLVFFRIIGWFLWFVLLLDVGLDICYCLLQYKDAVCCALILP